MILSKEMILTLTCLKTVGVKGVGPKKIFSIGKIIANEGSNVKDVKDLLSPDFVIASPKNPHQRV